MCALTLISGAELLSSPKEAPDMATGLAPAWAGTDPLGPPAPAVPLPQTPPTAPPAAPFVPIERVAYQSDRRAEVVAFARAQVGKWYRYGAAGPNSYDCSGLTQKAFGRVGVKLPHSADGQRRVGVRVSAADARPGDLVSYYGHVGVFVGNWTMVAAPGRGRRVQIQRVYKGSGLQFRRVIR